MNNAIIQYEYAILQFEYPKWDSIHEVKFSPPYESNKKIVYCASCDPDQQWSNSYAILLYSKQNAFKLINMLNELLNEMKLKGYCK